MKLILSAAGARDSSAQKLHRMKRAQAIERTVMAPPPLLDDLSECMLRSAKISHVQHRGEAAISRGILLANDCAADRSFLEGFLLHEEGPMSTYNVSTPTH